MPRQPVDAVRPKHEISAQRVSAQVPGQDRGDTPDPISGPRRSKPGAPNPAPGLHIVATPIGNLGDITLRALQTLAGADVIACEDTRVTAKLLRGHGITTATTPYHDHNAARAGPRLLRGLTEGQTVALVSDAGTPLISDPGFKLVRQATALGIPVTTAPGASAPLAALVLSGLPSDRFFHVGFLPTRQAARRAELQRLAPIEATLVVLESPRRLAQSLDDMSAILGHRDGCVARELTKLHEEIRRGGLEALAEHYRVRAPPAGESVVVIGPPEKDAGADPDEVTARLAAAIETMSVRDAAAMVAEATGVSRRTVYARALELVSARRDRGDD